MKNATFSLCSKILLLFISLPVLSEAQSNVNLGTNAGNAGSGNISIGANAGDLVTNSDNIFVGYYTGRLTTSGSHNSFIGAYSGENHTSGIGNSFYGFFSGRSATTGNNNTFIGDNSGYTLTTGASNAFLGQKAGYTSNGTGNVYLGFSAGHNNASGVGNVFIGNNAGYSELTSNKLYIDNSNTATPLIFGDFNSNQVGINALPGSYTLNVGGSLNASTLFVGGVAFNPNNQWSGSGANVNYTQGIVSIGTTATPAGFKLAIGGKAIAEEIVIKLQANWPDYVFDNDYKLPSLSEVERFIKKNKHLPGIPAAQEVAQNGVNVGEMNALLLKKVEELTLYVIELKKEVELLKHK